VGVWAVRKFSCGIVFVVSSTVSKLNVLLYKFSQNHELNTKNVLNIDANCHKYYSIHHLTSQHDKLLSGLFTRNTSVSIMLAFYVFYVFPIECISWVKPSIVDKISKVKCIVSHKSLHYSYFGKKNKSPCTTQDFTPLPNIAVSSSHKKTISMYIYILKSISYNK
jgi:hypothetical protein